MEKGKAISITLAPKEGGKEINFNSLTEASKFLGVNKMMISRILRKKAINNTKYFITSDW